VSYCDSLDAPRWIPLHLATTIQYIAATGISAY